MENRIDLAEVKEFLADVKKRIRIDDYNLSSECQLQPELYLEVAELTSTARSQAKRVRDKFEHIKASTESAVRANPDAYGLVKTTESSISNAVSLAQGVRDAKENLLEADEVADMLGVLLFSVEQRKSMLRDLVTLFVHSYYSDAEGTPVKHDVITEMGEDKISEARKRRAEETSD